MYPRFAILLFFFCSFASRAEISAPMDFKRITDAAANGFLSVMGHCPERVWPAYNWRDLDILILQRGASEQTFVSVKTGQVAKVPSTGIPSSVHDSAYSFFKFRGRTTLTLSLDNIVSDTKSEDAAISEVFGIGIHEAFHRLAQTGWKDRTGSRGTEIPIHYEPRLYRRNLFDRLSAALALDGVPVNLGHASYWHKEWASRFPSEPESSTDGIEGTARYVEAMGDLLRLQGCDATEENLRVGALGLREQGFGKSLSGEEFSLDGEGYELGALAGFVLRFGGKDTEWQARMKGGVSPLDVLLAKVAPLPDSADPKLEALFVSHAVDETNRMRSQIGEALQLFDAPGSVFVGIKGEWASGSEALEDTWIDKVKGADFTSFGDAETMKSPSGRGGEIAASPGAVFLEMNKNPCNADRILLFSAGDVSLQGSSLALHSGKYHGNLTVKSARGGRPDQKWLCAP